MESTQVSELPIGGQTADGVEIDTGVQAPASSGKTSWAQKLHLKKSEGSGHGLKGDASLIQSIIVSCSGASIYTVVQPAAQFNPFIMLLALGFMVSLYAWNTNLIVKYIPIRTDVMLDKIIADNYKKPVAVTIKVIGQISSWLLMFGVIVVLLSYANECLLGVIFNRFSSTYQAKWVVVIPTGIAFLLSFVRNPSIFVTLTGIGFWCEILSVINILYTIGRYSTKEDVKCWRASWHNPMKYGMFAVSRVDAANAVFSFMGVLATALYLQSIIQSIFVVSKKPSHNSRNVWTAYGILFCVYALCCMFSSVPFACDPGAMGSDYMMYLHADHDAFGIITEIFYFFLNIFTLPLFLHVSIHTILDYCPPVKPRTNYIITIVYSACVIAVSAGLVASGTSLQVLFQMGGVSTGVYWTLLPIFWDIKQTKGQKGWLLKSCFSVTLGFIIFWIVILQFCFLSGAKK